MGRRRGANKLGRWKNPTFVALSRDGGRAGFSAGPARESSASAPAGLENLPRDKNQWNQKQKLKLKGESLRKRPDKATATKAAAEKRVQEMLEKASRTASREKQFSIAATHAIRAPRAHTPSTHPQ